MMKAKIDKKLCRYCEFGDKAHTINGKVVCLPKMLGNGCKFDK
jgi:hypothetical protein